MSARYACAARYPPWQYGHYLGGGIEADGFELRAQLGGRFHGSIGAERCRPVLMQRARNRAATFRAHAFAEVFLIAANVEDLHAGTPDSLEQMCICRQDFRPRTELEVGGGDLVNLGCQRFTGQRLESAVEHSGLWMSRVFERPLAARRAHSGFILVKHDGLAAGDSERRKYPLELRAELRDAALGGIGMMKRERIEVSRAA